MRRSKSFYFNRILLYACELFDWKLVGENQKSKCREICVWWTDNWNITRSSDFLDFQDCGAKRKTTASSMVHSCTSTRFPIKIKMNKFRPAFLEKKLSCNVGKFNINCGFGITSMWGSQNDKLQEKFYRSEILFFDPGETGIVKERIPKNWKKRSFIFI